MEGPEAWRMRERVFKRCERRKGEVWEVDSPLYITVSAPGRECYKAKRQGKYYDCIWIRQRPVNGKKKPSTTIFARALGIGFRRFFSTAMREEKVRTLRALGPVTLSAASAAMGWIMVRSSCWDMVSIGAASRAYSLCNLSGSLFDGKDVSAVLTPVKVASSFPSPAISRAPRPRAVNTDALWPIEKSPL